MSAPLRCGIVVLLITCLWAQEPPQTYTVRGVVKDVRLEQKQLVVKHEAVPGLMEGMTMPFHVRDATQIQSLHRGDAVRFRLLISNAESWIESVEKVNPAAGSAPASLPAAAPQAPALVAVAPGDTLPDVPLIDSMGKPFRLSELRGHPVALTFVYTRCPLPDMCPLLTSKFATVQSRMTAEGLDNARLVSVSIDPEHDTPEILAKYAQLHGADGQHWRMAVGMLPDITRLALACGADFWAEPGYIAHHIRIVILTAEGRVKKMYQDSKVAPDELCKSLH